MRKRLLLFLKILFAVNLISAVCFFSTVVYYKKRNTSIQEAYLSLSLLNRTLLDAYKHQLGVVSNLVYSVSSFRDSVFSNSVSSSVAVVSDLTFSNSVPSSVVPSMPALPDDLCFSGYYEFNGESAVMIGNKVYHENDFILGFKIECISPSFVRIGSKFYPVK